MKNSTQVQKVEMTVENLQWFTESIWFTLNIRDQNKSFEDVNDWFCIQNAKFTPLFSLYFECLSWRKVKGSEWKLFIMTCIIQSIFRPYFNLSPHGEKEFLLFHQHKAHFGASLLLTLVLWAVMHLTPFPG